MTLEVNCNYCVPLCFGHVHQHAVAQDAGVVHQNVKVTEGFNCCVDHALRAFPVGNVVVVRNCFATHGFDFIHHLLCRSCIFA